MPLLLLTLQLAMGAVAGASPYAVLRFENYEASMGAAASWASGNIPLLDYPELDLNTTYYYRWKLLHEHIATIGGRSVLTEFLPDCKPGTPPTTKCLRMTSCAEGFHIAEATWLRDPNLADEALLFWLEQAGAALYGYSEWIGWSAVRRHDLVGNHTFGTRLLSGLVNAFRGDGGAYEGHIAKYLHNASGRECWFQKDGNDAMEYSISGDGCRPTINAILFGEADAIVRLAESLGNASVVAEFTAWRTMSQRATLGLWNAAIDSFAVLPVSPVAGGPLDPPQVVQDKSRCNLTVVRQPNQPVGVRELLAFVPWYFSSGPTPLIPYGRGSEFLGMWEQLFDDDGFAAKWGLRTAEKRHPCYNYTWDKGCRKPACEPSKGGTDAVCAACGNVTNAMHGLGAANRNTWNANSWPYETSRVLRGMANVLHDFNITSDSVNRERYMFLLLQFARQHTQTIAAEDTAVPPHSGHIFENLHPDLGYWNNVFWRAQNGNAGDVRKGQDYFHSSWIDLVISDLLGFTASRPNADGPTMLRFAPLMEPQTAPPYFALDGVRAANHDIALLWDADGSRYGKGIGMSVLVDGSVVATRAVLGKLEYKLPAEQTSDHPKLRSKSDDDDDFDGPCECLSTWYETTRHNPLKWRNAKDFGAAGDGRTEDYADAKTGTMNSGQLGEMLTVRLGCGLLHLLLHLLLRVHLKALTLSAVAAQDLKNEKLSDEDVALADKNSNGMIDVEEASRSNDVEDERLQHYGTFSKMVNL
jgi:hypothetical protein